MIQPELYDVVELLIDLPKVGLKSGQLGTILEKHNEKTYEVEFANVEGETLEFLALTSEQFIVVWKSGTSQSVPVTERILAMMEILPEDKQGQVLDFTRSLYRVSA
ncbi:MAG: DUF4926 domain-containing protein [Snowella sp.]|jgi:hypothetical protein|nr:MAG: DUF4926 domain-containing protein [Snowella sp.]